MEYDQEVQTETELYYKIAKNKQKVNAININPTKLTIFLKAFDENKHPYITLLYFKHPLFNKLLNNYDHKISIRFLNDDTFRHILYLLPDTIINEQDLLLKIFNDEKLFKKLCSLHGDSKLTELTAILFTLLPDLDTSIINDDKQLSGYIELLDWLLETPNTENDIVDVIQCWMKNYHNSKNWISFVKKLLEDNGQNYHYFQELINDIDFQQAIININHLKNKFDSSHLDRLRHDDVIKGINLLSNYGKINFQQFELIVNNHRLAECIAFLVDQSIIYNKNNFISSCQGFINFIMNNIDTINELKIEVVKNNISLDSADWDNLNNANIQSSLKRFIQLKSNINEKSNPLSCHYILSNIVQFEKLELVCQNEEIKQLIYKNYYLYESIISLEDHYFPQHCNRSDYFNTIKNLLQNSELTKNLINLYKNQSFNNLLVNHFSKIASIVNNEEDITFLKNINLYSIEQIDQYNKLKALDQKGILKNIQNINAKQSLITYSNYRDSEIFIKYINSIKDEKFNYLKECIEQCIKNYTKDDKLKELVNHIQYIIKIDSNLTDLINKLKSKISNPIKAKNITDENRDNYINNVIPIILNKDISKTERDSQIIQQSKKFIIDTQLSKDKSTTSKIARYFMLGITNTAYILTIVGPIVSYCVNKNNHFKNTNQKIFPFYRNTKSKNLMNQEVSNKIFNL